MKSKTEVRDQAALDFPQHCWVAAFYFSFFPDKKIWSVSAAGTHHPLLLVILFGRGLLWPDWNVPGAAIAATHSLPLALSCHSPVIEGITQKMLPDSGLQPHREIQWGAARVRWLNLFISNFSLLDVNHQKEEAWNFRLPIFNWQQ